MLNRTSTDMQLLSDDRRHAPAAPRRRRASARVTSQADWPTYHGNVGGNRYSTLDQIDEGNVARLAPRWAYSLRDAVAPAGDAGRRGRRHVRHRPPTSATRSTRAAAGASGTTSGRAPRAWPATPAAGINRGVAVAGDRVFMVTDHAHLIALDRFTGALAVGNGDGRLAAELRRHLGAAGRRQPGGVRHLRRRRGRARLPRRLRPGDRQGGLALLDGARPRRARLRDLARHGHRARRARRPGSPAPTIPRSTRSTGRPATRARTTTARERQGDNLYSDSILALDPPTGRLKWHFQYTPHDVWDWDAQQPPVLVDIEWEGRPRRLLLHANRNGFFYVLDRTNGALLLAKPFVKKLTWAREIGADGRPVLDPRTRSRAPKARRVCPAVEGATNWFSTSFIPRPASTTCRRSRSARSTRGRPDEWQAGQSYYGGTTRNVPGRAGAEGAARDRRPRPGAIAWELPQTGPARSWGGTLATAGGLVFFGEDSGALMAVDAATGAPLWQFQANALWKASPMTYMFDGRSTSRSPPARTSSRSRSSSRRLARAPGPWVPRQLSPASAC